MLIQNFFPHIDLKVCFTNNFKISSLFKSKDVMPVELRSNFIYKFECGICQDSYIGHSTKTARFRWCQHLGISFRTKLPLIKLDFSPVRNHSLAANHPISVNNFRILDHGNSQADLKILESLYIHDQKPNLNTASSAVQLIVV